MTHRLSHWKGGYVVETSWDIFFVGKYFSPALEVIPEFPTVSTSRNQKMLQYQHDIPNKNIEPPTFSHKQLKHLNLIWK